MNLEEGTLWKKIEEYQFDSPEEDYCFSTKLADEQQWTEQFTADAILEYKKFMFLATVSNQMVSPSATIDKVWHQHLTFSDAYEEFCTVLGKKIKHMPATGKPGQQTSLKAASDQTAVLYKRYFKEQVAEIWNNKSFEELISLDEGTPNWLTKINDLDLTLAALVMLFLLVVLWKELLVSIDNPNFLWMLTGTAALIIGIIVWACSIAEKETVNKVLENKYLVRLSKEEQIVMMAKSDAMLLNAIHELIESNRLKIDENGREIHIDEFKLSDNKYENLIVNHFKTASLSVFSANYRVLIGKPMLLALKRLEEKLSKVILNTVEYTQAKLLCFTGVTLLYSLLIARGYLGITRGKPIAKLIMFALFISVVLGFLLRYFWFQKRRNIYRKVVANSYNTTGFLDKLAHRDKISYPEVFTSLVIGSGLGALLYGNDKRNNSTHHDDSSTGCSSSCGSCSSCSSCGGCGGD